MYTHVNKEKKTNPAVHSDLQLRTEAGNKKACLGSRRHERREMKVLALHSFALFLRQVKN
jgi:hypothetical protein